MSLEAFRFKGGDGLELGTSDMELAELAELTVEPLGAEEDPEFTLTNVDEGNDEKMDGIVLKLY